MATELDRVNKVAATQITDHLTTTWCSLWLYHVCAWHHIRILISNVLKQQVVVGHPAPECWSTRLDPLHCVSVVHCLLGLALPLIVHLSTSVPIWPVLSHQVMTSVTSAIFKYFEKSLKSHKCQWHGLYLSLKWDSVFITCNDTAVSLIMWQPG